MVHFTPDKRPFFALFCCGRGMCANAFTWQFFAVFAVCLGLMYNGDKASRYDKVNRLSSACCGGVFA